MNNKYLWCPHCKCYPDSIYEKYVVPHIEFRTWDGEYYELTDTNLDLSNNCTSYCKNCNTELVERENIMSKIAEIRTLTKDLLELKE